MNLYVLSAIVFAVALGGTGLLRRYALARSVIDVPNERSSHTTPTPRGGGVAIVVAFLFGTLSLAVLGQVGTRPTLAVLGGGIIVATVGFIDDHRHIPARWRLVAHFGAATWAIAWLGGLPHIDFVGRPVDFGLAGDIAGVIALVWVLNLYNFMDGIDGIAGLEACTVCFGAALLALSNPVVNVAITLPVLLGVASLGFLLWNFPPAKIFMGDAGSGFLGLTLGVLTIASAAQSPRMPWGWLILLGVFVVDATVTLLRRLAVGAKVYEAHRSHAYQHASRRFGQHRPVTLATGAINLAWLLPWAWMVTSGRVQPIPGVVAAYAPLVGLALAFRAGRPG